MNRGASLGAQYQGVEKGRDLESIGTYFRPIHYHGARHESVASVLAVTVTCHLWYDTRMEFKQLLDVVGDEPVFETGLLLAGNVDAADVRRQLSRWTKAGRLYQLRRGLYALAPPFQKVKPHPFLISNRMLRGSYVSCESALAHYNLIPEGVPMVT